MIRVLFVCLGNICRSPMAHGVFQHLVDEAGLSDVITVDSAGTGDWHAGEPVHSGTQGVLNRHEISFTHRARQVDRRELSEVEYVVAMDSSNYRDLRDLDHRAHLDGRLSLLLDYVSGNGSDVPDPYYEDNFNDVYELVEAGCRGLLEHIREKHEL